MLAPDAVTNAAARGRMIRNSVYSSGWVSTSMVPPHCFLAPDHRHRSGSNPHGKRPSYVRFGLKVDVCGTIVMAAFPRADSLRSNPSGGILEM